MLMRQLLSFGAILLKCLKMFKPNEPLSKKAKSLIKIENPSHGNCKCKIALMCEHQAL